MITESTYDKAFREYNELKKLADLDKDQQYQLQKLQDIIITYAEQQQELAEKFKPTPQEKRKKS